MSCDHTVVQACLTSSVLKPAPSAPNSARPLATRNFAGCCDMVVSCSESDELRFCRTKTRAARGCVTMMDCVSCVSSGSISSMTDVSADTGSTKPLLRREPCVDASPLLLRTSWRSCCCGSWSLFVDASTESCRGGTVSKFGFLRPAQPPQRERTVPLAHSSLQPVTCAVRVARETGLERRKTQRTTDTPHGSGNPGHTQRRSMCYTCNALQCEAHPTSSVAHTAFSTRRTCTLWCAPCTNGRVATLPLGLLSRNGHHH